MKTPFKNKTSFVWSHVLLLSVKYNTSIISWAIHFKMRYGQDYWFAVSLCKNNIDIVTYMNWIYSIDEEFLLFLPKFLCWIQFWGIDIGSGESFRRQLDHKGDIILNGIGVLMKRCQKPSFVCSKQEHKFRVCDPGREFSQQQTDAMMTSDLSLPASGDVKNLVSSLRATQSEVYQLEFTWE